MCIPVTLGIRNFTGKSNRNLGKLLGQAIELWRT